MKVFLTFIMVFVMTLALPMTLPGMMSAQNTAQAAGCGTVKCAKSKPKTVKKSVNSYEVLTLGKAKTITLNSEISDVVVANPSMIEVGVLKNNRLYLVGSALGDTNVLVFGPTGDTVASVNVHVRIDEYSLNKTLKKLFPEDTAKVNTVGDDIFLHGRASNSATAANINEVVSRFVGEENAIVNMMTVAGEQQVMIKVKVVEISRDILNEIGVDTDLAPGNIAGDTLSAQALTNNEFGFNPLRQLFGLTTAEPFGLGQLIFDPGGFNPISFIISALEQDQLVNTLAEPNLTAKSGENARFLAGGEIPVVADRTDDRITFDYRPFGVVLAFRPVVLDENRISLQISTEVSEISADTSTVVAGVPFPSFDVRRAETTVEMASGGSLMIAGLVSSQTVHNLNGLPGIGDVPVLGDLAKSDSFSRKESELLIMISAYLISPNAADDFERSKKRPKQDDSDPSSPVLRQVLASNLQKRTGELPDWTDSDESFGYILD